MRSAVALVVLLSGCTASTEPATGNEASQRCVADSYYGAIDRVWVRCNESEQTVVRFSLEASSETSSPYPNVLTNGWRFVSFVRCSRAAANVCEEADSVSGHVTVGAGLSAELVASFPAKRLGAYTQSVTIEGVPTHYP
jgi:hypothetical protein